MNHVVLCLILSLVVVVHAVDIGLPTGNDGLLRPGGAPSFFQPTIEGTVESGMFGCVRRNGRRFHEGVDIRCLQRDRRGEPTDPVYAAADGEVVFVNAKPGLSNYGRYVMLEHRWDGVQVFTLYAHLREIQRGLVVGQPARKGEQIGILGRSTNTREGISSDRAHVHFEVNFMLNPNFRIWYPKRDPDAPPFGNFNGLNFLGMDPAALLRTAVANTPLNFAEYVARQPVGFTVLVSARPFPWLTMHPEQIRATMTAPVAYEIAATAWGLPVAVWPREAAQVAEAQQRQLQRGIPVLNRVHESELARNGCRDLVQSSGRGWTLTEHGRDWVTLLTYNP